MGAWEPLEFLEFVLSADRNGEMRYCWFVANSWFTLDSRESLEVRELRYDRCLVDQEAVQESTTCQHCESPVLCTHTAKAIAKQQSEVLLRTKVVKIDETCLKNSAYLDLLELGPFVDGETHRVEAEMARLRVRVIKHIQVGNVALVEHKLEQTTKEEDLPQGPARYLIEGLGCDWVRICGVRQMDKLLGDDTGYSEHALRGKRSR